MSRLCKKLSCIIGIALVSFLVIGVFPFAANASDDHIDISGRYYEFDDDSSYDIASSLPVPYMDHATLGTISIKGTINKGFSKEKIAAYEVADDDPISICFTYDDTLKDADEKEWHLYKDSKKKAVEVDLSDKIGNGVLIFQTSLNGKQWATSYVKTDLTDDVLFDQSNYINDIQLLNGCYYRVILAYELQKKADPFVVPFIVWDTPISIPDNDYIKNAEVYEFYLCYVDAEKEDTNKETYAMGSTQAVVVDSGFAKKIDPESDDPHLGWNLGKFVVDGYTQRRENNGETVFLKNEGDKVALWFKMSDDIDINKLNGNDDISIHSDSNGFDSALNVAPQDFKRGALIVRFTDYQGKTHDPKIYTNFLEALSYPGADTRVQLFEEGDYEVSLDYEIKQEGTLVDKYYNYKIAIEFKIRNGNKKVYPRDVSTGSYLANTSVTENGFVLDWARSRYLQVNVKYSRWTKGADGKYVEDVIFDQPAKETDAYKKTGVYTFTVKNPSTGETTDPTKIYVGSDSVLIAYVNPQNTKYTVEQISNMVDNEGYTISRNGELIPPVVTVSETTSSETIITTTETTTMSATTLNSSQSTVISSESLTEADAKEDETGAYNVIPWIGLGTVGLAGITVASFRMTRHRKSNENRKEEG